MWVVTKKQILLFVALFILFAQTLLVLDFFPLLDLFFSGLRLFLFCIVFVLYLKYFYITKLEFLLGVYAVFVGVVSILYSEQKTMFFFLFINITTLLAIFKFFDFKDILRCSVIILSFFVYLNFLLTLLYPGGHFIVEDKPVFILGRNYNSMGPVLLAALLTNAFYFYATKKLHLNLLVISMVSFFTVVFMGSMTSAVGIGIFIIFILMSGIKGARLILKLFFIFVLSLNFILLYLQIEIDNNYAVWFVEVVLGKDMTFTGRADVWLKAMFLILNSFWFGYGIQPPEWFSSHFDVLSAHNFILTMLLKGGVILFGIFVLVAIVCIRNANKNINRATTVLQFGCCSFLLMLTMESYSMILVFYFLFLNYFSENLYIEHNEECT